MTRKRNKDKKKPYVKTISGQSFFQDENVRNRKIGIKQSHLRSRKVLDECAAACMEHEIQPNSGKVVVHHPMFRQKINKLKKEMTTIDSEKKESVPHIFIKDPAGIDVKQNVENAIYLDLGEFDIIDDHEFESKHVFHVERVRCKKSDSFIAAKVARRLCTETSPKFLAPLVNSLRHGMHMKPKKVKRGKKKPVKAKAWAFYGYRKQPKSTDIGEYVFSRKCNAKTKLKINTNVQKLAAWMEEKAKLVLNQLPISEEYSFAREYFKMPIFTGNSDGFCTQFAAGLDYWSSMHDDTDYFFSTLSCYSNTPELHKNKILYHFAFPEHKFAIPMRHGDVLVFDPRYKHCATNPRFPGCFISSAYISQKTINTHVSCQLVTEEYEMHVAK